MSDPIEFKLAGGEYDMKITGDGPYIMECTDMDTETTRTLEVPNLSVACNICAMLQYSENMHEENLIDTVPMFKATYDFIKNSTFASLLP